MNQSSLGSSINFKNFKRSWNQNFWELLLWITQLWRQVGKDRYFCFPYLPLVNKCHQLLQSCSSPISSNYPLFLPRPHSVPQSITWSCWLRCSPFPSPLLPPGSRTQKGGCINRPRFFHASLYQALSSFLLRWHWAWPRDLLWPWDDSEHDVSSDLKVAFVWDLLSLTAIMWTSLDGERDVAQCPSPPPQPGHSSWL